MVMSWIFAGMILISIVFSFLNGTGSALSASVMEGAQAGVTLAFSMAGAVCLWSGAGKLMEKAGITELLSRILSPLLRLVFPSTARDPQLAGALSGNFCANLLGLGNAATPLGIQAALRLKRGAAATDELCRLIVLNTASIQVLPTTVAAVRSSLGCHSPFDILPAVWITSLLSSSMGILAAICFGKLWKHD